MAASNNAFDDQYPSPYTVEAVRQGMDLPWWEKLLGARFKDGKFQLARLKVRPSAHVLLQWCAVETAHTVLPACYWQSVTLCRVERSVRSTRCGLHKLAAL